MDCLSRTHLRSPEAEMVTRAQRTFLGTLYQKIGTGQQLFPTWRETGLALLSGFIRQKRELRQLGLLCDNDYDVTH